MIVAIFAFEDGKDIYPPSFSAHPFCGPRSIFVKTNGILTARLVAIPAIKSAKQARYNPRTDKRNRGIGVSHHAIPVVAFIDVIESPLQTEYTRQRTKFYGSVKSWHW
jgi:hypothetical protein